MIHTLFPHVHEISPGKNDNFHPIGLLHLPWLLRTVLDFVLFSKLIRNLKPYMKFLFVRPGFCLRLPSDSASRRTPLPLANASYCQGAFGTFTLKLSPMPGTLKRKASGPRGFSLHSQFYFTVKQVFLSFFGEHRVNNPDQGVFLIIIELVDQGQLLIELMVLNV